MDLSGLPPDAAALGQAIGLDKLGPVRVNTQLFGDSTPARANTGSFFPNLIHSMGSIATQAVGGIARSAWSAISGLPSDLGMNLVRSAHLNPAVQQSHMLDQRAQNLFAQRGQMSRAEYGTQLRALTSEGQRVSANIAKANAKYQYAGTGKTAVDAVKFGGLALTALAPVTGLLEEGATAGGVSGARAALAASKAGQVITKGVEATGIPARALDRNPLVATAGKLTRNALLTQPMADLIPQTINDVKTKNYTNLVENAAILTSVPVFMHFAAPVIAEGFQKLGLRMFGQPTFLSKFQFQNGETFKSFFDGLSAKAATGDTQAQADLVKYTNTVKQFVDHNAQEGNNAQKVIDSEARNLRPVKGQTAQQFLDYHGQFVKDTQAVQDVVGANPAKYGIPSHVTSDQLGVGNFSTTEKNQLVGELLNAPDQGAREAILSRDQRMGKDYTRNQGVWGRVVNAVRSQDPAQIDQIKDIVATRPIEEQPSSGIHESFGLPDKAPPMPEDFLVKPGGQPTEGAKLPQPSSQPLDQQLELSNGRIPIVKPEGSYGFTKPEDLPAPDFGTEAGKVLGRYGKLLTNLGLSPQAVERGAIDSSIRSNLGNELTGTPFEGQSEFVMRQLQDAKREAGVADVRELKLTDIQNKFNVSTSEAKTIQSAIKDAYAKVPLAQVGLGPKLVSQAVARVPFMDRYLRLQQKYRFDNNYFFQARRASKNYLAALSQGGAFVPRPSEETVSILRGEGVFNKFATDQGTTDFLGVMPDETGKTVLPGGKQMSGWEQRVVGGLAESLAEHQGSTVHDIMAEGGEAAQAIRSAAKLTTGYGDGGYLNSPLAKTLNVLVFPSRFDTKIGMLAYHALANQPPIIQAMTMKGIVNMSNFLNSSQGQQWQRDNSEFLGVIKYFTPLTVVDNVMSFLTKGYHVGDLGSIGGLPFGVVSQFLNDMAPYGPLGASQYTDPKTGNPIPTQVPNTAKAMAQVALRDLIESTFTYPGKELGLSLSKSKLVGAVPGTTPAKGETTPTFAPGVEAASGGPTNNPRYQSPPSETSKTSLPNVDINSLPTIPSSASARARKAKASKVVPANLQIHR